ncbi:MAG: EamA family transporter [Anaerolineae bacterium]
MEQASISRASYMRGVVQVAVAGTLWGTIGPVTAVLYQISNTSPISISFLRAIIATPIMAFAAYYLLREKSFTLTRRDLPVMMVMGTFTGISQTCYFAAISRIGVTIPTLIAICLAPVIVAVLSFALGYERFSPKVLVALVFALIGTALVVGVEPESALGRDPIGGVLLSIGSGVTYAGVIISGRFLARRAHALQINTISLATNSVLLLVIGLFTSDLHLSYSSEGWLLFLFLGLVPTAMGYMLFLTGMRTTSATITGIITLLEPLTAALLAWVFFGERLTPLGMMGALLLLGAIVVLARGD